MEWWAICQPMTIPQLLNVRSSVVRKTRHLSGGIVESLTAMDSVNEQLYTVNHSRDICIQCVCVCDYVYSHHAIIKFSQVFYGLYSSCSPRLFDQGLEFERCHFTGTPYPLHLYSLYFLHSWRMFF